MFFPIHFIVCILIITAFMICGVIFVVKNILQDLNNAHEDIEFQIAQVEKYQEAQKKAGQEIDRIKIQLHNSNHSIITENEHLKMQIKILQSGSDDLKNQIENWQKWGNRVICGIVRDAAWLKTMALEALTGEKVEDEEGSISGNGSGSAGQAGRGGGAPPPPVLQKSKQDSWTPRMR